MMMDAWHGDPVDDGPDAGRRHAGGLADRAHAAAAVGAARCEADVVHASMNGLSMLVGMAAKWRTAPRCCSPSTASTCASATSAYLQDDAPHAGQGAGAQLLPVLAGAAYLIADALAPHSAYNRRWQLQQRRRPGSHVDDVQRRGAGGVPAPRPSEPAEPTIVFIGRIDPLKDLHTLIRAFALVRGAASRTPGCGSSAAPRRSTEPTATAAWP